ncbi:MAG: MFS transporter [Gammaproteobacteria bacterium]|nr:MFS transporter [Gammaproteobacteria bacterium]
MSRLPSPSMVSGTTKTGQPGPRGILGKLVCFALALLLVGQAVLAWLFLKDFEEELKPQLNQKAIAVGQSLAGQVGYAIDGIGIPVDRLVGMDEFFDDILVLNQDIEYLALVRSPDNRLLYVRGLPDSLVENMRSNLPEEGAEPGREREFEGYIDLAFPVAAAGEAGVVLHVGVGANYVRNRLLEILFEVLTVIVVTGLLILEFLLFFFAMHISEPARHFQSALKEGAQGNFSNRFTIQVMDEFGAVFSRFNLLMRDLARRYEDFSFEAQEIKNAQIDEKLALKVQGVHDRMEKKFSAGKILNLRARTAAQIRVPLLLFFFAEELSRSFLPLLAARHAPNDPGIPVEMLMGLPITLFMVAAMVCTPFGRGLADRIGPRRVFLVGAGLTVPGFIGVFLTQTYYDFVVWRMLSGAGFGLMLIASQTWVEDHVQERHRATGMSTVAGSVFAGLFCGPPLGAIIAGRIGFEATFLVGAAVAAVSGLIVFYMLDDHVEKRRPTRALPDLQGWLTLLTDARFVAASFLAAFPSRLLLTGVLFFLAPLYLDELGNRPSTIGWIIMLYGLAGLAILPVSARIADWFPAPGQRVALGAAISGTGCVLTFLEPVFGGATATMTLTILFLGIGHGIMFSPALAVTQVIGEKHRDTVGQSSVITAFRMVEQLGLIVGPVVSAVLVICLGFSKTIVVIGGIVLVCTVLYGLISYNARCHAARTRQPGSLS